MKLKLVLLVAAAILILNPVSARAGNAELCVKRDSKTIFTLRISDRSLNFFCESPSQLMAVLREQGIDCCTSQVRVSEAVWNCCHGNLTFVSYDSRVQSVMDAAFTGQKYCQR